MKKFVSNYFFVNNIKMYNIEKNRNIIDYLENLNIKIPHYCYHPKLSVSGNCRMCLVELKNSPKPLISCAMTITNNLEIYTDSPLVKKARENILEFLLLNHPLDCPVCDQGGECDLQDQSFIFGSTSKRFFNYKRSVVNKNLGPIVKTVMTRCIHCTRCVRFATEIAGVSDLGMYGRGYKSEIGTYVYKMFDSELSGNVIDICPVGALTNKPYSFIDRNWELTNFYSIDCMDGFGENLNILVKNTDKITKIYPSYFYKTSNNNWISNKTRFSFDGMFTSERILNLTLPNLSINTWKNMFIEIVYILYFQIHLNRFKYYPNIINILVGENLDIESLNILLLLKKCFSFIKLCKLKENNFILDQESSFLTNSFSNKFLNEYSCCLIIGTNTRLESPSLNIKLKQRSLEGNFSIYSINTLLDLKLPYSCLGNNFQVLKSIAEGTHPICQKLKKKKTMIIYNSGVHKNFLVNRCFKILFKYIKNNCISSNSFNNINKSLSESTISYINNFNCFTLQSFKNSLGLYLINVSIKENFFKKIIYLKLLNYIFFFSYKIFSKVLINQVHMKNVSNKLLKQFNVFINLPNTSFYESSGFFFNSEGYLKKSIKIIPSKGFTKTNSEILKNMYNFFNTEFYKTGNILNKNNIICKNNKFSHVLIYFMLNFSPLLNFKVCADSLFFRKSFLTLTFSNFQKNPLKKNRLTKTYLWLDDFYIGGKDLYSVSSKVMVECSKLSRIKSCNFNYAS